MGRGSCVHRITATVRRDVSNWNEHDAIPRWLPSAGRMPASPGPRTPTLSQPAIPPASQRPLRTPSFAPTGSGSHSKPVLRFRQLLAAQAQWGQSACHCLRPRASGVRRRGAEQDGGRGDSERLRTGPPRSRAVAEQVPFHAAGCRR